MRIKIDSNSHSFIQRHDILYKLVRRERKIIVFDNTVHGLFLSHPQSLPLLYRIWHQPISTKKHLQDIFSSLFYKTQISHHKIEFFHSSSQPNLEKSQKIKRKKETQKKEKPGPVFKRVPSKSKITALTRVFVLLNEELRSPMAIQMINLPFSSVGISEFCNVWMVVG